MNTLALSMAPCAIAVPTEMARARPAQMPHERRAATRHRGPLVCHHLITRRMLDACYFRLVDRFVDRFVVRFLRPPLDFRLHGTSRPSYALPKARSRSPAFCSSPCRPFLLSHYGSSPSSASSLHS